MDLLAWILFNVFVLAMLALDLGVFHRKAHAVSIREASIWTVVWVVLALVFNAFVLWWKGPEIAAQFLAGYLIEKSLSVDNIFVFALVFGFFAVPPKAQHRVLFWGVLGALVMRFALILAGAWLIESFHWIIYVFGAFLVVTGIKMALVKETSIHPDRNILVRLARKIWPVTPEYHGEKFFVRREGRLWATPLFLAVLVVEATDLVFAVDSIPAIFAVSRDPFIVYTSNVFAILGLRSLYFVLAGMIARFRYLKYGLSAVLAFVGVKMLLVDVRPIPITVSLAVIAAILATSIVVSLLVPPRPARADHDLAA